MKNSVLVLGSLNLDLLLQVPHLPRAGETMHSLSLTRHPGGKGANQAAASAALGSPTCMIGAVGADDAGTFLRQSLAERGVDLSGVRTLPQGVTGQAYIHVAADGENTITLHGGANQELGEPELAALEGLLPQASLLLLQLEIPLQLNVFAAQRARAAGVTVILDPAPATDALPEELLRCTDIITPNEHEAQTLTGAASAPEAASRLLDRGVSAVVLKQGRAGALLGTGGHQQTFSAPQVEVISTVAAGDTFNGALADQLNRGASLETAVQWAVRVASLRVSRPAGYAHLPQRSDL